MNTEEKKKMIEAARSWIGYKEKAGAWYQYYESKNEGAGDGNYTRFGRLSDVIIFGADRRHKDGFAWCCMFILAVLYEMRAGHQACNVQAGKLKQDKAAVRWVSEVVAGGGSLDFFAGCSAFLRSYKSRGAVSSIPHAGDFVLYVDHRGLPYHIGIIESVEGDYINTIEGNTSSTGAGVVADGGQVAAKRRKKKASMLFLMN